MNPETFDLQTILLIAGAAVAVLILLLLLLRGRRQSLRSDRTEQVQARVEDPYAVTKERPYVKEAAPPPPAPPPPAPAPAPVSAPPQAPPAAAPPPPGPAPVQTSRPEADERIDVSPPPVPIAAEFGGIAFPPHSTDHPDPLTRLKGVGPKLEAMLNDEGITRFEQLASLDEQELAALEERLGSFKGRLTRDRVIEQARLLASGDTEEFEARFGKLGGA